MTARSVSYRQAGSSKAALVGASLVLVALLAASQAGSPSARSRSDAFWGQLSVSALNQENFESIDAMARSSDAVVVGTIRAVELGRTFGDHPANHPDPDAGFVHYLAVSLDVSEVLAGAPMPKDHLVEFILPDVDAAANLGRTLPLEPTIFFLRSKAVEARSLGLSAEVQAEERRYFRLINTEAMLRGIEGKVRVFDTEDPSLRAVEGSDFERLVAALRASP